MQGAGAHILGVWALKCKNAYSHLGNLMGECTFWEFGPLKVTKCMLPTNLGNLGGGEQLRVHNLGVRALECPKMRALKQSGQFDGGRAPGSTLSTHFGSSGS